MYYHLHSQDNMKNVYVKILYAFFDVSTASEGKEFNIKGCVSNIMGIGYNITILGYSWKIQAGLGSWGYTFLKSHLEFLDLSLYAYKLRRK